MTITKKVRLTIVSVLLTLLSALTPVFSGGPLLIFDPFTRTPFAYGPTVGFPVPVFTDLGQMGPLSNRRADELTAAGFAEWTNVPTSFFSAAVAGDFRGLGLPDITGANAGEVIGTFNGGGSTSFTTMMVV